MHEGSGLIAIMENMAGSLLVYLGLVSALIGLLTVVKPMPFPRVRRRSQGLTILVAAAILLAIGFLLPAPESRVSGVNSHLDEFLPVWQFRETHSIIVAAPPERVYQAMKQVRADEILLFRTLTWIRRGGRDLPESILNAGSREALIDVAIKSGFGSLADEAPKELVIGTVVLAPSRTHGSLTPNFFRTPPPPGFAIAAMNFTVRPDGAGGSRVSTETRVFASGPSAKRRFARYWRLIYPGSALIRRMWLRAIRERSLREMRRFPQPTRLADHPKTLFVRRDSLIPVERDKLTFARLEICRDDRGCELDGVRGTSPMNSKEATITKSAA